MVPLSYYLVLSAVLFACGVAGFLIFHNQARERGMLTANELAAQLGVCPTSIHLWARRGLLRLRRRGVGQRDGGVRRLRSAGGAGIGSGRGAAGGGSSRRGSRRASMSS